MPVEVSSNMFCLLLTHTSTHLNSLQHQVSYDARARLWVRKTDKLGGGGVGGWVQLGKFIQQKLGPEKGEEAARSRGGWWDGEEEKGAAGAGEA